MAVIILTMLIVKRFVFEFWMGKQLENNVKLSDYAQFPATFELDFYLLIWSTLLLAAAGNIINDYFDIRADRVNRPHKILIGRYVKKRWAIVTHWAFNATGIIIAAWLAYKYQSWWILIIPVFSSIVLGVYSIYLKRKVLIGNIMIAVLTALVVVLPTHFIVNALGNPVLLPDHKLDLQPPLFMAGLLTTFAFITNLTREIVKDLHDVPGDKKMGCETIPIVYGNRFTKFVIGVLLALQLFLVILFITVGARKIDQSGTSVTAALALGVTILTGYIISFIINITAKSRGGHYRISGILKLIMLLGILFPLIQLL